MYIMISKSELVQTDRKRAPLPRQTQTDRVLVLRGGGKKNNLLAAGCCSSICMQKALMTSSTFWALYSTYAERRFFSAGLFSFSFDIMASSLYLSGFIGIRPSSSSTFFLAQSSQVQLNWVDMNVLSLLILI